MKQIHCPYCNNVDYMGAKKHYTEKPPKYYVDAESVKREG